MAGAREALERLVAAAEEGHLDVLAEEYGVALLGAFGSATRTAEVEPDDLDLAIAWRRDSERDYLGLLQALTDLAGFERIDLMDLDRATPVARSHGVVGRPLYEHVDGAFAQAQIAALLVRMDTDWLRRLELDILAS